jgi:hypothetical protein
MAVGYRGDHDTTCVALTALAYLDLSLTKLATDRLPACTSGLRHT